MGGLLRHLGALVLALAVFGTPGLAAALPDAMSMGSPRARVVVEEYASPTCSHCARFNEEVFPAFKKKYVDTGKVRYVIHEFVTAPPDAAAMSWLMARCAGPKQYFAVIDAVMRSQSRWQAGQIRGVLKEIGMAHGLTDAQVEACVRDENAQAALQKRMDNAMSQRGIDATPTFYVNGVLLKAGEVTLEELDAAIAAAAKGRKK